MPLPITREEMKQRGWSEPDIVVVTGDAYVDHPSFGAAIISRVLEAEGFRVCILSQPQSAEDMRRLRHPEAGLFCRQRQYRFDGSALYGGKRRRSEDAYTPGGKAGRPARPRGDRLLPLGAAMLSRHPDCARRTGGVAAPFRALRLLGR